MIRAFFLILFLGASALVLIWATQTFTGDVLIPLGDTTVIEVNIVFAAVGLILAGGLIAVLWGVLANIYALPTKLSRGRRKKAERRAETALTEGLLAAEAGDIDAAVALAKKAAGSHADERLKTLLEARAAEAAGRWNEAEAHWARLASMPGGQLAGLRGAAAAAAERGDDKAAEDRTRSALHLNSGAEWPFQTLFEFQVSRADWAGALETLAIGKKRKILDDTPARRRRAVLLTAKAASQVQDGENRDAASLLAEAVKIAPEFPPAIYLAARQHVGAERAKLARSVLESGWKARPHPALAHLWRTMAAVETGDAVSFTALIKANPDHIESHLLRAEEAFAKEDWQVAAAILEPLGHGHPSARICQLLANAYVGLDQENKAENWRRLSLSAARDADWSDLSPTGGAFDFSPADWGRLVYDFGDRGTLIHTRHETFQGALDVPQTVKRIEVSADASPTLDKKIAPKNENNAPKTWTD